MSNNNFLYTDSDWSFADIKNVDDAIKEIALNELKLDIYPNQLEMIDSSQMLDAYSSHGLPIMYSHWSFGKRFLQDAYSYRTGQSGLAREIVINSNPCISYLMEENTMTMQALVIAHAAYGHNHFFKNNYLFRQWTDAEGIIDYMNFARNYINKCEEKYGVTEVEMMLDACHSIMHHGVDRYKRPAKLSKAKELEQQRAREEYVQRQANELWNTIPNKNVLELPDNLEERFPSEPQENLLYFIEKHSPILKSWQREIVRIVRKVAQYFYPQMQCRVMNEGWASFVHYYVMNRLWEKNLITDGNFLEFIHSHSGVLTQLPFNHKYYNGYNPYALGFDMFTDIRRICTQPTAEDEAYFPHLIGQDWLDTCLDAVQNYRDESFIAQFLSPAMMRKWKMFEITNNEDDDFVSVSGIQDKRGYDTIRKSLSSQYSIGSYHPNIQVVDANLRGDRSLTLKYTPFNKAQLGRNKTQVVDYVEYLWGYDVYLDESD